MAIAVQAAVGKRLDVAARHARRQEQPGGGVDVTGHAPGDERLGKASFITTTDAAATTTTTTAAATAVTTATTTTTTVSSTGVGYTIVSTTTVVPAVTVVVVNILRLLCSLRRVTSSETGRSPGDRAKWGERIGGGRRVAG